MNSFIKTLAFCALLGASGGAYATEVLIVNGDFEAAPAGTGFGKFESPPSGAPPGTVVSYPTSGGNPGGYGQVDNIRGTWGGGLVSPPDELFDNKGTPIADLGLVAGGTYVFKMDMKNFAGTGTGGLKLESWTDTGRISFTPDMPATGQSSSWATYSWTYTIAANATRIKIVPLATTNSGSTNADIIGFDNIRVDDGIIPPPPPPPSPPDVVLNETFDVASPNWGAPTGVVAPITGSATWSGSEGNGSPKGSTILTVSNPLGSATGVAFTYTATDVDFGIGPVQISFDGKLLAPFLGPALHVRYNGIFIDAIQGNFNDAGYTTFTRQFPITPNFLSSTFTLQFEFAMGADPGSGGSIAIDNIVVRTTLPGSAPPTTAQIQQGVEVAWVAGNSAASYQPQEATVSASGPWTNLGTPISGTSPSTKFDSTPSPFYQVVENVPAVFDNQVFNPGFEANPDAPADGWSSLVELGGGSVSVSQSFPGGYLPQSGIGTNMLVLRAKTAAVAPAESAIAETRTISSEPLPEFGETTIPVKVGTTYNFSFYALNALKSDSTDAQYMFFIYDEFGSAIETPIIGNFDTVGNTWTKVETTLTIPETLGGATVGNIGDDAGVVIAFRLATGPFNALDWVALIDTVSFSTGGPTSPAQTNILAATKAPAVDVSWKTVTGRDYQVESSTSLQGWGNFGDSVAGDGSIFSVTDLITPPRKFYRVLETSP